MDPRAADLIASLGLAPHPEGGHYREVHRSDARVHPQDARPERAALTTIYFLLASGKVSRWHRVASDEAWHFYEGAPLELFTADVDLEHVTRFVLGPASDRAQPVHVVRADHWQAARSTGAYSLVGCTVAPGFEFADFQMLREQRALAERARRRHPELAAFI